MKLFGFGKDKKQAKRNPSPAKLVEGEQEEKKIAPEKNTGKKEESPKSASAKPAVSLRSTAQDISRVLINPRITEKATIGIEKGVYVFDVSPHSNKRQVTQAIRQVYNVNPRKVHITKVSSKNVKNKRTGMKGVKSGGKKAYVYLKKGDNISII